MNTWLEIARQVEPLEDLALDADLVAELERRASSNIAASRINFHTPTFKSYTSSEISGCGKSAWPAISITGSNCKLQCDHCKAKVLEPMLPATTPEALWRVVNEQIGGSAAGMGGAAGMLLTGGSNHRNEVEYDAFYPVIRRIKDVFPTFKIAVHTALADSVSAQRMADAGIDVAMMDVIGAQDTITQVYHLKRSVDDFERTLESLVATSMKVVPHIVLGLHYGRVFGEWQALEIIRRHQPDALVLVVAMPFYAPADRPFVVPDSVETGQFFMDARAALPAMPLLLGCARPPGLAKLQVDTYAVMAGLNGIAHPADGVVELAIRLGREVRVTPACCSIAVGDEVMGMQSDAGLQLDMRHLVERERVRKSAGQHLAGIQVVAA
jgi:uncharacterized radical SAM superfamily protein